MSNVNTIMPSGRTSCRNFSNLSLGHDEGLTVFLGENDERRYPPEFHNGFFRFSVGIKDKEDILADLKQAMTKTGLETV